MNKQILLLSGILLLCAGCNLIDTANQIKDDSQHLSKRTDDLEREMTRKESWSTVLEDLQMLFAETPVNPDVHSKNREPDMLFYAGAAVEAMLFQYWNGDYNETIGDLDLRFQFSAEVMLVKSLRHVPRSFAVDVWNPDASYSAIASLGAKLDRMSAHYSSVLEGSGLPQISLYDVIVTALSHRDQARRDELLPKATAMVLQYPWEAIYLLQLRHNYLPMMVLGRMTDLQGRGLVGRLLLALGWTSARQIDLNTVHDVGPGVEQLKEWTLWLERARQTREDLRKMGIAPEYNSVFVQVLRQIDFGQKALLSLPPNKAQDETVQAQVAFAKAYKQVVDEASEAVSGSRQKPTSPPSARSHKPSQMGWLN